MLSRDLLTCALAMALSVIAAAQTARRSNVGQEQLPAWAFDLPGVVELMDQPPGAATVETVSFALHPLDGGFEIWTTPDRQGKFVLKGIRPEHYSLTYTMPGRIQTFAQGADELAPEGFELRSDSVGPLRLVISMKVSEVYVKVFSFPSEHRDLGALLAPADARLVFGGPPCPQRRRTRVGHPRISRWQSPRPKLQDLAQQL